MISSRLLSVARPLVGSISRRLTTGLRNDLMQTALINTSKTRAPLQIATRNVKTKAAVKEVVAEGSETKKKASKKKPATVKKSKTVKVKKEKEVKIKKVKVPKVETPNAVQDTDPVAFKVIKRHTIDRDSIITPAISKATGVPQGVVYKVLSTFVEEISKHTFEGKELSIKKFGRFFCRVYPARTMRNPRTGAKIDVKEAKSLAFKPLKRFRGQSVTGAEA